MFYMSFYDSSEQKLSQKVILPELKVGMISSIVYLLNAKKAAITFLYLIKNVFKLKYKKNHSVITHLLLHFVQYYKYKSYKIKKNC